MVEISRTHRKIGNYVSLQVSRSPEYVTHIKNSLKLSQKGILKLFAGEYELTLSQLNLIFPTLEHFIDNLTEDKNDRKLSVKILPNRSSGFPH